MKREPTDHWKVLQQLVETLPRPIIWEGNGDLQATCQRSGLKEFSTKKMLGDCSVNNEHCLLPEADGGAAAGVGSLSRSMAGRRPRSRTSPVARGCRR